MFALWALSALWRRIGSAEALIWADFGSPSGSWIAWIAVILVPEIVSLSWTSPYLLEATSLVTVLPEDVLETTAAVGVDAAGAWAWKPSAAAVPMTVALRTTGARL